MALAKFWLLNGSKKKGKKSVKKVSKKTIKRVVKKSVSKPKVKTVVKKVVKKVYVAKPVNTLPTSLMTSQEKIKKYNRGNKPMARRKRAKRSVAKATKIKRTYPILAKNSRIGSRHRITAFYGKGGALTVSRKSKIAKGGLKINPFKIKGIVNTLKPAVVLSATSVGTIFGLNKVMPKIPYIEKIQNSFVKAGIKVALGLIGQMGVKKVVKNDNIANGVLIGAIISALTDFVSIQPTASSVSGIKLNGVKVLGNPLSFGRPKTALANPNFQMNGIKIPNQNLSAIKFPKNYNADNTVSGCADRW